MKTIPLEEAKKPEEQRGQCPNCGAWTEKTIAESILCPSYDRCAQCGWTNKPEWKLSP